MEELDLVGNRVSTLLRQIHEVKNGGTKVSNGGDRLHFNSVHLLQRMVENSRRINGLEPQVFVVKVTDEQTLGGESIGLYIDIGTGDAAQKAGFPDIGVTANQQGTGVGVNRRQTAQVLTDLLQVDQGIFQTSADGGHTTQRSTLELLALEQGLRIFDQADIVARNSFDQVFGRRDLTKGDFEMIGIVKRVHQILVWGIRQSRFFKDDKFQYTYGKDECPAIWGIPRESPGTFRKKFPGYI